MKRHYTHPERNLEDGTSILAGKAESVGDHVALVGVRSSTRWSETVGGTWNKRE